MSRPPTSPTKFKICLINFQYARFNKVVLIFTKWTQFELGTLLPSQQSQTLSASHLCDSVLLENAFQPEAKRFCGNWARFLCGFKIEIDVESFDWIRKSKTEVIFNGIAICWRDGCPPRIQTCTLIFFHAIELW